MKKFIRTGTLVALPALLLLSGCVKDHDLPQAVTFKVLIENVSQPQLIPTPRANGTVPLSPGVYAVYRGADPMFQLGAAADLGTEEIAEDGTTTDKLKTVMANADVLYSGVFKTSDGPIFSGESTEFTVTAKPGDKLQLQTMFVQSNDWFISFKDGGYELFTGSTFNGGDVSGNLEIYDAGTEADTAPGTGPDQKPVQMPASTLVGPVDAVKTITVARTRQTSFTVPGTDKVIRVTLTPQ